MPLPIFPYRQFFSPLVGVMLAFLFLSPTVWADECAKNFRALEKIKTALVGEPLKETPNDAILRLKATLVKSYFSKIKVLERNGDTVMETIDIAGDAAGLNAFRKDFDNYLDLVEEHEAIRSWQIRDYLKKTRGEPYPDLDSSFVKEGMTMEQLLKDVREKMRVASGSSTQTRRARIVSAFNPANAWEKAKKTAASISSTTKTFAAGIFTSLIATGQASVLKPAYDMVTDTVGYARDKVWGEASKLVGSKEEYIKWLTELKLAGKKMEQDKFSDPDPSENLKTQLILNEFETTVGEILPKFRPTMLKMRPKKDEEDAAQMKSLLSDMNRAMSEYLNLRIEFDKLNVKVKKDGIGSLSDFEQIQFTNYLTIIQEYEGQVAKALAAWKLQRLSLGESVRIEKKAILESDDSAFSERYRQYMKIMNKDVYRKELINQLSIYTTVFESYLKK